MRIELYTPRWQSEVARLGNRIFGQGYFVRPSEIAREADSILLVCHENDQELLGFAQGRLLPKDGLRGHLQPHVVEAPDDVAEADRNGTLGVVQALAVSPDHRHRGIGTKLVTILHDRLIGLGADKLIVTFKRGPSAARVDGMMQRLGFELWTRLPTYWREQCDNGAFQCVDRENGCSCEALLYRKAVY